MNRQRKVVITVTYNDLGMIVDTKAEELNLSAQPNLQPACNQLATDSISRQAAIDAAIEAADEWDGGYNLTRANMIEDAINNIAPPTQPEQKTAEESAVFLLSSVYMYDKMRKREKNGDKRRK